MQDDDFDEFVRRSENMKPFVTPQPYTLHPAPTSSTPTAIPRP